MLDHNTRPGTKKPRCKAQKIRMIVLIVLTVFITSFLSIFILNLRAGEKHIRYQIEHRFGVADPQFLQSMGQLLGPAVLRGNKVTALHNGDQIFPAMLKAIRGATNSITFETYIYWSGEIGKEFSDALVERAKAGVKVHVLLDWAGSGKIDASFIAALKNAGAEVERYHPIRWYTLTRINNRTHRKLLVVDGTIGFTGGVGIADLWRGNARSKEEWRDSHFRLTGPAVAQMQAAFTDNWIKTRAKVLYGKDYFPEITASDEGALAQVFKSSKGEGSESVRLMYLLSIASAQKSIRLEAAYFVPDNLSIDTLIAARKRGVTVEIIVPGPHTDTKLVQSASRSRWGDLLDAGVKIYEYQPTMYHCKVMIVDDLWVSVGSTNFDDRSFRLNDEANLNIYDSAFAREQVAVFEEDKKKSKEITKADFKERSRFMKIIDHAAGTLRRQL